MVCRMKLTIVCCVWFGLWLGAAGAFAERPVVDDGQGEMPWLGRMRRLATTPEEQLARARRREARGRLRRADREYRRVVSRWPAAQEAAEAQLRRAELLQLRGRRERAFEAYKTLLTRYPHDIRYDEVVERMYGIAVEVEQQRRMRILGGGYANPEAALPLFTWLVEHAPRSSHARDAQMRVARIQEAARDFDEAVEAYTRVSQLFPGTEDAIEAMVRRAICLYEIAGRRRQDVRSADEASFGLRRALRLPLDAEMQEDLSARLTRMDERRARHRFERGRFYETTERRPDAAIRAYRSFLREFPDTPPWSEKGRQRLAKLEREVAP